MLCGAERVPGASERRGSSPDGRRGRAREGALPTRNLKALREASGGFSARKFHSMTYVKKKKSLWLFSRFLEKQARLGEIWTGSLNGLI